MKRITFLLFLPVLLHAQLKVHTDGTISVKSEEVPRAFFDIPEHSSNSTVGQFGSFGIQSTNNTNGFLINNAYWNADIQKMVLLNNGGVGMLQFREGDIYLRNLPSGSAGSELDPSLNTFSLTTKYDALLGGVVGVNTRYPENYNLYVNGTAYKSSGGSSWAIPSDKRLKENIQAYKNATNAINKINIYEFSYNGKGGTIDGEKSIGVIAQELKEIFPDMVKNNPFTESDGKTEDYLSVESGNLIYVLIAAFNEQTKIIKNLSSELNQIRAELEMKSLNKNISEED